MIRILIAEDQMMVSGALSALLNLEPDLEVIGLAKMVRKHYLYAGLRALRLF